jgi:hypothetical protein
VNFLHHSQLFDSSSSTTLPLFDLVDADAMATPAPLGLPPDEATYTTLEDVKAALQSHARDNGYGISVTSSRDQRIYYAYTKGGKYRDTKSPETHESRRRKNTSTMKTDCRFSVVAKKCPEGWKVDVQNNNHNHGPIAALSALPQHRIAAMNSQERAILRDMNALGYSPTQILDAIRKSNPESNLIPRDIYNLLASMRVEELDGKTPVEWLLQASYVSNYNSSSNSLTNSCRNSRSCISTHKTTSIPKASDLSASSLHTLIQLSYGSNTQM